MLFLSYYAAQEYLKSRSERPYPLGSPRATRVIRRGATYGDPIAIKYHDTDVVTYTRESITLNSGGWKTVTTKRRMNDALPDSLHLYSKRGVWYINDTPYQDGIQVTYSGDILSIPAPEESAITPLAVKIYVHNFVEQLYAGLIDMPSGGDCWYCAMKTQDGKSLGDITNNHDHLREHIKKPYYVPSLLFNAVNELGSLAEYEAIHCLVFRHDQTSGNGYKQDITKHLVKYLNKRLGIAL